MRQLFPTLLYEAEIDGGMVFDLARSIRALADGDDARFMSEVALRMQEGE